jgi:thymidylate kinase
VTSPPRRESASLLSSLLRTLNASTAPYCILHGYTGYPEQVPSDVDCLIPADLLPGKLALILDADREALDAGVVQWIQHQASAHYFVLARPKPSSPPEFLAFDASSDYRTRGTSFYRGEDILHERRLHNGFYVPQPRHEFGYYLVKKVTKGVFTEAHTRRLSELYGQDPAGCAAEIERFWGPDAAKLLTGAARTGDWRAVDARVNTLRKDLLRSTSWGQIRRAGEYWCRDFMRRVRRWAQPSGLHVVLLGPDGAGKSTVAGLVAKHLSSAFRRVSTRHLRPGLFRPALAGPATPPDAPHSRPARSLAGSLAKSLFWLLDYTIGYQVVVRPALVRSTLVLFDRYLLDVLVDPKRYRYGGPARLIRAVWRLVPKPDLVILLDAHPEILQSRKRDVSLKETQRQRTAYRQLVEELSNGHVVDAAQPVDRVAAQVEGIVLQFLRRRTARRLGLTFGEWNAPALSASSAETLPDQVRAL